MRQSSNNASFMVALPLIVALLAVAIEPIVVKFSYQMAIAPLDLLILRTLAAGVIILPFCGGFRIVKGKALLSMLFVSLLFLGTNVAIYFALQYVTSITLITAVTTTPAFVAIVNSMLGKERLGATFWGGFCCCFLGVLLSLNIMEQDFSISDPTGFFFIALAIIGSTIYRTRMDKITATFRPKLIANYIFLLNGIVAIFAIPYLSFEEIDRSYIGYGFWLGFAAVIGNLAFLSALKVLGSTKISIIGILQRPLLVILSAFLLNESLGIPETIGIALVLYGVHLAKVQRLRPENG